MLDDVSASSAHRRRSGSLVSGEGGPARGRRSAEGKITEPSERSASAGSHAGEKEEAATAEQEEQAAGSAHRGRRRGDVQQETEDRLARGTMLRDVAINAALIGLWYSFSIAISVYNKWMFSKSGVGGREKGLDFHFPLFTTSLHMIVQFSLAAAVLYIFPRFRPTPTPTRPSPDDPTPPPTPTPLMTTWFYLSRIGPCGTATALDIGLGNFSLRFISLTFYTMCKSSVLSFVLLFAFLFRLERPTAALCAIILVMTAGVIMMVAGETAFNAAGFLLVMSAAACSGFRWSLTQILLLRNPATGNPFSSIFFLTPVMFLALAGWFAGAVIMLAPGCLAFLMVAAEFALLQRSSVVTLSVCGIFKEVLTISVASVVFGDELSPINLSGLIVTILSIAGYNYLKWGRMKEEAQAKAHQVVVGEGEGEGEGVLLRDSREGWKGREGEEGVGLMRESLSLRGEGDGRMNGGTVVSHSPVKRPEDIE
ncbi:nucleotide-sugar transporter like protein [Teratosphaeria destructans]|uniref:Nucleotide-sugar transporter like protein n=1 Tax=Teratosphaeria destructans TaxID=418781 RepID=A0A9W7W2N5_9PEZI|nr:nucleotide-sugar transporter like protein [Teratosphaeria destructans]